jgi:hypothetical protein
VAQAAGRLPNTRERNFQLAETEAHLSSDWQNKTQSSNDA